MAVPRDALTSLRQEADQWADLRRGTSRTLRENQPDFPWWDHEAAAIDDRYNEQDPGNVAARLQGNAERLGLTLPDAADQGLGASGDSAGPVDVRR